MMKANWRIADIFKPTLFSFLKLYIADHFPRFTVFSDVNHLYIRGVLTDEDWKNKYEFIVSYGVTTPPVTFIINPELRAYPGIHLYRNRSLCLYHPNDLPEDYHFVLATDIIPWLVKWIHYYEIWCRNGHHWMGPEAPHA